MPEHVSIPFDVTGWTDQAWEISEGGTLGRARVTKSFHGELEGGTSVAELVTAVASGDGPAAYVGIERVTGSLVGRSGTFVLMHSATASEDQQSAKVSVVPGLGTGDLAGLRGSGTITIDPDGAHALRLDYELEG